jgi:hypothetical protein
MRAREVMSTDFRLVDASWAAGAARRVLEQVSAAFIVVNRRERAGDLYYLYRREELLARLSGDGGDLREVLGLRETGASQVVPANGILSSDAPQVVMSRAVPVGVIMPSRRSRGGPKRGGPVESASPPQVGPVLLTRHLTAELPASIPSGTTASLLVSLVPGPGAPATTPLAKPAGTKIEVLVKPGANLTLVGTGEGTLEVSDPQPDLPLRFRLKAGAAAGPSTVRVYAFCDGASIASITVETMVAFADSNAATGDARESLRIEPAARSQPDLSIFIFEQGDELTFRLSSRDGAFYMKPFGPVTLRTSPHEHFQRFFSDIENLPLDTPEKRQTAQKKLEAKGANLFELVFPEEVKVLLWNLRDRIGSVQITSDEPWIPWEACRLVGKNGGRIEEHKFFAEAFSVTRWLYGVGAPTEITLEDMAVVVPGDSGLDQAPAEKSYVLSLANGKRKVREVPASYLELTEAMEKGTYDAWHFTGHARADAGSDADQSAIELASRETLKPGDVAGRVANVLLPRPFVFLNACQSAQAGLSLTGIGGWAQRFLHPGPSNQTASAFVGSYWSVYDETALGFAKALYDGLLAGTPIGEAARAARLAIRKEKDPTWLAYTVYGDPNARVRRV